MNTATKDKNELRDELQDQLGIDNPEAVPTIEKVIVNVGIGDARDNLNRLETVQEHLARITGQEPVVTRAKKSVAGFNIREGDPCGVKVTLRGKRMEDFLGRLINLALPRTKDFQGLDPSSFDGQGNYTLGIKEQAVFPEVSYEEAGVVFGMDITITTTADDDEQARALLDQYNMPFREEA
jgi:large subunit ribosomal protein L5